MAKELCEDNCWFSIINNKAKILPDIALKYGFITDKCTLCDYAIISTTYQQSECGSRYCKDCYERMEDIFYCNACRIDDPNNFVHSKSNIFIDRALIKDMKRFKLKCPDCIIEMKFFELENHVNVCPEGWIHCLECTNMVRKKPKHKCEGPNSSLKIAEKSKYKVCQSCGKECKELSDHALKCTINWKQVICPYGCCVDSGDMEEHRKEKSLFHLDKSWAIMQSCNLTESKKDKSPVYEKMVSSITENIRKSLGIEVNSVDLLADEIKSLNETIKDEIIIYESIKSSLKFQISDSLYTSYDGTILWRIDNFEELKAKAAIGEQKSIFSPPFFTSRFGYKICLRLYPNGDTTASGVAMSLFLVLMKGNYDSLLTWPFKQKVTFILLDQDFKTNMIDAFVPSDNLTSFSRPRTDMNIPSGSSYFIKFEDMKLHKYVKDNTIFIRCIIDCSDLHE